jgi:hypothetical protein
MFVVDTHTKDSDMASPVVIEYSTLLQSPHILSDAIQEAFGPDALGVIVIKGAAHAMATMEPLALNPHHDMSGQTYPESSQHFANGYYDSVTSSHRFLKSGESGMRGRSCHICMSGRFALAPQQRRD